MHSIAVKRQIDISFSTIEFDYLDPIIFLADSVSCSSSFSIRDGDGVGLLLSTVILLSSVASDANVVIQRITIVSNIINIDRIFNLVPFGFFLFYRDILKQWKRVKRTQNENFYVYILYVMYNFDIGILVRDFYI